MGGNKLLLGALSVLIMSLLAVSVSADQLEVSYEAVQEQIFIDEEAVFEVTIENNEAFQERVQVYSNDPRFQSRVDPAIIDIDPGQSQTVTLYLNPVESFVEVDRYGVPIVVKGVKYGGEVERTVTVVVKSDKFRTFTPSVFVELEINEGQAINPREPIVLDFRFVNKNRLDITELQVTYDSFYCSGEFMTTLTPLGELQKRETCTIDPLTEPGDDVFRVNIFANGDQVGAIKTYTYTINEITELFGQETKKEDFFLRSHVGIDVTNNANVQRTQTFTVDRSTFEKAFTVIETGSGVEASQVDGGYEFIVTLGAGQTTNFSVETNVRMFFVVITLIVLVTVVSIVLYYQLRSPILLKRKMSVLHQKDGGKHHIKVILHVQNRTGKLLEKVKVIERIPSIAEVEKSFDLGTLKPTKIVRHEKSGTLIRWDFSSIEPFEERIISYKVSSKLGIVGKINFPQTTVKFSSDGGKSTRTVKFNANE